MNVEIRPYVVEIRPYERGDPSVSSIRKIIKVFKNIKILVARILKKALTDFQQPAGGFYMPPLGW